MKTWDSVPNNITAFDAFKYCIENGILTNNNKLIAYTVVFDSKGNRYGGFTSITVEEIIERKAIVCFFEGFTVIWTDVIHHTEMPVGFQPFENHSEEVKDLVRCCFCYWRQFSGTRDEVKAFTSRPQTRG